MAKSINIGNVAALFTICIALISGTYHFYSQDKRLTIEEQETSVIKAQVIELKTAQESSYCRLNDKLDQVNINIRNLSVSFARMEAFFDDRFGQKDEAV